MKRAQGCAKASMCRMYGMKRAQGCAKASMYRMYGMKRAQGCAKASMYRMYGMKWCQDGKERYPIYLQTQLKFNGLRQCVYSKRGYIIRFP